jgi:hypothetical protein
MGPDPGDTDGVVGLADPPGPSSGVGNDHSKPKMGCDLQPLAECRRAPIGIAWQQQDGLRREVGRVDAGRGNRESVVGADDTGLSAAGNRAAGLRGDQLGTACRWLDAALGLADDLGRDNDDVAVAERPQGVCIRGREDRRCKIGVGCHLSDSARGEDRDYERLLSQHWIVGSGTGHHDVADLIA